MTIDNIQDVMSVIMALKDNDYRDERINDFIKEAKDLNDLKRIAKQNIARFYGYIDPDIFGQVEDEVDVGNGARVPKHLLAAAYRKY